MDELQARARRQLDGLHDFQDGLASILVREESADGLVTVAVDGNGALRELRLAPGIDRLGGAGVGAAIVSTAALAAQRAFARRAALTETFVATFAGLVE